MSYSPVYISHPATSTTLNWGGSFCNHRMIHHNYPHLMLQTLDRSDPCQHNEQNHQTRGIPSVEQLQSWIESNKETNIDLHHHHDSCILKIQNSKIKKKMYFHLTAIGSSYSIVIHSKHGSYSTVNWDSFTSFNSVGQSVDISLQTS